MTGPIIAMVAGEASGDFLGAHLIAALKKRMPNARFVGIGGPKMESQGFESWYPMERLSVRGYVEVLRHYAGIVAMRRSLAARIEKVNPALFIGIDAPDFNLDLERRLKCNAIRTVHYVSPSIWAWRGGRIKRIARSCDRMLVVFPFEETLYKKAGIPVTYVGHPMADMIPEKDQTAAAREQLRIAPQQRVIALLPGSRQSELRYLAQTFIRTAQLISAAWPDVRFLVPLISRETREIFETTLYAEGAQDLPLTVLFGHSREAIAASDAVLVASGTATLETALFRKPMVIAYRMAESSWKLMNRMRYQPWVGLPNIIAEEFVVPEFLQSEATPGNLAQALMNEMSDVCVKRRVPERLGAMHQMLRQNTAERAAEAVQQCMR
jgi:lipid-A-disaccharide synthase